MESLPHTNAIANEAKRFQISHLLRMKAIEAFEVEKRNSIDFSSASEKDRVFFSTRGPLQERLSREK